MKKISILLIALVASLASQAQQWVSTAPANKNVILEEFTGKNCTWCPDGHELSDQLAKDNPGRYWAINVHEGTFSPATNPNYNTTVGAAIGSAASSGTVGWPCGSVNRKDNPWAMSRSAWASKVTPILAESSPVNVFVKSSVDYTTRMLTTEVEIYYTANGPGTSNKLTVALLQNGILGPQTGMDKYPAKIVGTQYQHDHMLRMHLTPGTFGESITDITTAKYTKKTYNTVLPANINSIPLDIYNLEVVAFVSEANNNILSGHGTLVAHNDPNKVDLELSDISVTPSRGLMDPDPKWCINKATPKIEVTNNTITTITSFEVSATINGVPETKTFTGSLAQGQKTTIDWGEKNVDADGYVTLRVAGFSKINGGTTLVDYKKTKDTSIKTFVGFKSSAITSDFTQTFDNSSLSSFKSLVFDRYEGTGIGTSSWTAAHGAENTARAAAVLLYGVNQETGHIVMGKINLNGVTDSKFTYYYAYHNDIAGGTAPTISASYSTDCGVNWTELPGSSFQPTQTGAAPASGNYYIPTSNDYLKKEVDLNSLKNKEFLFRVSVKTGQDGNALYLDQFNIKITKGSGGSASTDTFHVKVNNVGTANPSSVDVTGGPALTKDSMYTWKITDVKIPNNWTFLTICDAQDCVNYPTTQRNTFKAKGILNDDKYKITIDHKKNAGYGYVMLKAWRGKDSTSTTLAKDLKFSLLASVGSSISLVSDASDKLLHYFDSKLFVDVEFNGAQLEVYDIKGQLVLDTKVASDNIDFAPVSNGIYIARISKDGQVMKTHKFSTSK